MAAFSGFFGILAALLASIISYGRWPTPLLAGHVKLASALGWARANDVCRLVMKRDHLLVGIGLSAGFPLALIAARAVST
jgi:hypothetical protein